MKDDWGQELTDLLFKGMSWTQIVNGKNMWSCKKLLLSPSTSAIRHSGHLFSRYETTLREKLAYREITSISVACSKGSGKLFWRRWHWLQHMTAACLGAALWPLQHSGSMPFPGGCCRSHLFPTPQAATQTSGKPSPDIGHTETPQFTETMAKASIS